MSRTTIGPLQPTTRTDQHAELQVYLPDRHTAVVALQIRGQRGRERREAVQLDGHQRRQLAALLAGHSDWTGWARSVVAAAITEYLDTWHGSTDDNGDLAEELTPVVLRALHYDTSPG